MKIICGPDSIETMEYVWDLTIIYRTTSNHDKARELCKNVIPYFLRRLGPDSMEKLDEIVSLASSYLLDPKLLVASELSLRSLHMNRTVFGSESDRTLRAMCDMGVIYLKRW